mgnify:CR=1 FL=1
MKQLLCITSYFFFFAVSFFYPDSFRVNTVHAYTFDAEAFEPVSVSIGYNDAVAVAIKSDCLFLEGIELEIKQGQTSLNYPNSIAYTVYTDINPGPSKRAIDYSAKKISTALLPNRFSHIIRLPVKENYGFKQIKNSEVLPYTDRIGINPVMLRLNPVMKGLPDDFENAVFTVIIRPLLIAAGGLKLKLYFPENEQKPVTVQLNNEYLTRFDDLQLLSPGTYSVTISSDAYRTEMRSCIIERGKTTELEVHLKSITPLLHIQAPENVSVFLDSQEITLSKEPLPVAVGVHTVVFKMGSYELTRQLTVGEGKTYEMTMTMDVLLQEIEN